MVDGKNNSADCLKIAVANIDKVILVDPNTGKVTINTPCQIGEREDPILNSLKALGFDLTSTNQSSPAFVKNGDLIGEYFGRPKMGYFGKDYTGKEDKHVTYPPGMTHFCFTAQGVNKLISAGVTIPGIPTTAITEPKGNGVISNINTPLHS